MQTNKPIPYRKIVPMINQIKVLDGLIDNKQQIASEKKRQMIAIYWMTISHIF